MKDALKYKGLTGTVHFSIEDQVFFGKIEGIQDMITFEGSTLDEVEEAFQSMVNMHLEDTAE